MLKGYLHKSFLAHALNHVFGIVIAVFFVYLTAKHPSILGFKAQYDLFNSAGDTLSFTSAFLIIVLIIIQIPKGYLLYIPSTYVGFDKQGISFRRFKREYKFVNWIDVQEIELKVESDWLLTMYIKTGTEGDVRVELTELWLLSVTKKMCVNYNFLKLSAIANKNPILMSKLVNEQVEELNASCKVNV